MRLDVLQTLCRSGFQPPATPDFRWCPNAHAARFRYVRAADGYKRKHKITGHAVFQRALFTLFGGVIVLRFFRRYRCFNGLRLYRNIVASFRFQ